MLEGLLEIYCQCSGRRHMKMFDGGALLIPAVHHQVAMGNFPTLGVILSHGYLY